MRADPVKISSPSLNPILPVFLDQHGSNTAAKPSPKGSNRHSQPPPTAAAHSPPLSSAAAQVTSAPLLCFDFRPHVPAENPAANTENPQSSGRLHRSHTPPSFLQWHTSSLQHNLFVFHLPFKKKKLMNSSKIHVVSELPWALLRATNLKYIWCRIMIPPVQPD